MKKVALGVALILACALLAWWALHESDPAEERVSGRDEPGAATTPSPLVAEGPSLEGAPPRAVPVSPSAPEPLRSTWAIQGRVVDDQGIPVSGAELTLRAMDAGARDVGTSPPTDELGRFRLEDVVPGPYLLRLEGNGRETLKQTVHVIVGDVTGLEFVVASGRSVEVFVETGGIPMAGLLVYVKGADDVLRSGVTDAVGRAVFVAPEGHARAGLTRLPEGWLRGPGRREALIAPTQTSARLALVRADPITGVVRRRDGQPLPGAVLWFRPNTQAPPSSSDERGAFRLAAPEGAVGDLVCEEVIERSGASSPSAFYGIARGVRAGATGVVVEVDEVARDRTVTVLVRNPEGMGVPRVRATVWVPGADSPRFADTDASGRGTLTKLPARPVVVNVMEMGGGVPEWLTPLPVEVVPDGQEVVIDFRRGVRLNGRITGSAGPVAGARVLASNDDQLVAAALSDEEGRFGLTIDPAAHFPLTITARPEGRPVREARIAVDRLPSGPIELRLDR